VTLKPRSQPGIAAVFLFSNDNENPMPNLHRGEIEAEIGGATRRLVLTLGALAELEAAFGVEDLVALAERFGTGRLKARDLVRVIGAGLRGAGEAISDDEVARLNVDGGAAGYVRIAAALLAATFGVEEAAPLAQTAPA
jgi:hypothetical protein